MERHRGSVRSSDDRREGGTRVRHSDNGQPGRRKRASRRDLIVKAGVIGCRGSRRRLGRGQGDRRAEARRRRAEEGREDHVRAGAGPGAHRAVRGDPHLEPLGQGADVRVPRRVGREAQPATGARRELEGRRPPDDRLHAPAWRPLPQRQGGHGRRREVLGRGLAQPAGARERRDASARSRRSRRPRCGASTSCASRWRSPTRGSSASSPGRATRRSSPRVCTSRSTPAARGSAPGRSASSASSRAKAPSTRRTRTTASRACRTSSAVAADASRRAGPHRGAARRGDRRRDPVRRRCPVVPGRQQLRRPSRAHRRLPRAPDHAEGRREQAVARQAGPAGGQLRDQPPGDPDRGLQRLRRVLRARPAGLRAVAAHRARSSATTT